MQLVTGPRFICGVFRDGAMNAGRNVLAEWLRRFEIEQPAWSPTGGRNLKMPTYRPWTTGCCGSWRRFRKNQRKHDIMSWLSRPGIFALSGRARDRQTLSISLKTSHRNSFCPNELSESLFLSLSSNAAICDSSSSWFTPIVDSYWLACAFRAWSLV